MNQRAYIEIEIIKNDFIYRAQLPLGSPWADAHEALLSLASSAMKFREQLEQQAKAQKELEEKSPQETVEAEVVNT